jgi:hypothetical protein
MEMTELITLIEGYTMNMTEMKPLKPLDHGNVLIVGTKASNFDTELRTHPRVIMWDSQNEHWTNKDIPQNVQAIFITKWIGHAEFGKILQEARKKRITIFNPQGTGIIAKQVRELLTPTVPKVFTTPVTPTVQPIVTEKKETETIVPAHKGNYTRGKLTPLIQYIDWSKTNRQNAQSMLSHAKELGINTTQGSLEQLCVVQRRKHTPTRMPRVTITRETIKTNGTLDVSIQLFDEAIKGMQDMRAFLLATVEENQALKAKLDKFRKMIED